jgi:hypothetical protein
LSILHRSHFPDTLFPLRREKMMRTLVGFLFLALAVNAGHALASEDPALPMAVVVVPDAIVLASRPALDLNWQGFDVGASESITFADGGKVGWGATRPPRGGGSIALPPGGQIVLTNPGGTIVVGGSSATAVGGVAVLASIVPEPAAPVMLLAGLGLLAAVRRKSARRSTARLSHGGHESTVS